MNRQPIVTLLLFLATLLCWAGPALGTAPRYTDKDTALELAQVLDKGIFNSKLISSTFVQSAEPDRYLVKVVLENGGEQNWDLHQIRTWTQNDVLTLSKNRVLVFPKPDSNAFGVLDKNRFAQTALRARVFARHYEAPDVLAGQTINYAILNFNLADLLDLSPGRDRHGYLYRYVFDLENGQRELLSYVDAWLSLQSGALMEAPPAGEPVMRTPYRLKEIRANELQRIDEGGIGRFGVEMIFDRPVELQSGHFPFRLYEEKGRNGKPKLEDPFAIEFTAPNAVMPSAIHGIEHLEFLYNIQSLPDPRHANRVLLKANLAPQVLTSPPTVEVAGSNVIFTFTKVEDQSVFDREALREAELRHRQEKLLAGKLSEEEIAQRERYQEHMQTGLAQLDRARAAKAFDERLDILEAALANFKEAAISASSDQQLEEALRHRNKLLVRIPRMIVDRVRAAMDQPGGGSSDELRELLRTAANMTRDRQMLDIIGNLARELEAR